jgi:hypothetical protein
MEESSDLEKHAISATSRREKFLKTFKELGEELPLGTVRSMEAFQWPSQSQYIQRSIYQQS